MKEIWKCGNEEIKTKQEDYRKHCSNCGGYFKFKEELK